MMLGCASRRWLSLAVYPAWKFISSVPSAQRSSRFIVRSIFVSAILGSCGLLAHYECTMWSTRAEQAPVVHLPLGVSHSRSHARSLRAFSSTDRTWWTKNNVLQNVRDAANRADDNAYWSEPPLALLVAQRLVDDVENMTPAPTTEPPYLSWTPPPAVTQAQRAMAADLAKKHELLMNHAMQVAKAKFTKTQEKIHEIVSAEDKRVHVIPHVPGEHTWPPLPRKDSFDDVDDVQGTLGADNKHPGWR